MVANATNGSNKMKTDLIIGISTQRFLVTFNNRNTSGMAGEKCLNLLGSR